MITAPPGRRRHRVGDVNDLGGMRGVVERGQVDHRAVVDPLIPEGRVEFDAHSRERGQRDFTSPGDTFVQNFQQLRQQRPDGFVVGKNQVGFAVAADHGESRVGHHRSFLSFLTTVRVSGSMVRPDAGSV